jgi:hypothetical protein
MGNKIKSNKKDEGIRIITDKQKSSGYTFIEDGLTNHLNHTNDVNPSEERQNVEEKSNVSSYILRKHSDKLNKKNDADYMRFKSSKITKARSKQNHSPVYE